MTVYHGSDTVVDSPRILDAKRPLDFGGGFYVTTSEWQAKQWAIRVSYRNACDNKCVNSYEFDYNTAVNALNIIEFQIADEN